MLLRLKLKPVANHLPADVVDIWPEVLEEVLMYEIPLPYIQSVIINFKDNKSWEIKLTAKLKKEGWSSVQDSLTELLLSYDDRIDDVDFKIDAVKIKKDIVKSTTKFLKKNKL